MFVNREVPDAYFLTWTGYGTWLPGDRRGSIDDDHNLVGHDPAPPDAAHHEAAAAAMRWPAYRISVSDRPLIEATIRDHCRIKRWRLRAVNVRVTHVHVVVSIGSVDPDVAMEQLKAWCTRRLREAGIIGMKRQIWTRRGSTRYCWTEDDVAAAVDYVSRMQGQDLQGQLEEF
jgi:REP element-mobilizing transposase RayT